MTTACPRPGTETAAVDGRAREGGGHRLLAVIRWTLIAALTLLLLIPAAMPVLTGYRLVVVDGGSMAPTYEVGDVLLTGPPTGDDLRLGRVLVVGTSTAAHAHRVVEIDPGSETRARMRGDANTVADPGWITQADVYAVPVAAVGGVAGTAVRSLITVPGTIALGVVVIALLLPPTVRGRRRRRRGSPTPTAAQAR